MSDMDWAREQRGDVVVIHLPDVLIATNRLALKDRVEHGVNNGERRFLVDFADTRYIDSSGLGVLVMLSKYLGRFGGELRLANLNEELRKLLALSKLDTILTVLDADHEA